MPTVLDSFVLEFGLDASKFSDEQKKLMQQMKELLDGTKKGGDQMEAMQKKTLEFFSVLRREAIVGLAAFFGGREIIETLNHFTAVETSAARLGKQMNMSAKEVIAWGRAFKGAGLSAEAGVSGLSAINDALIDFHLTKDAASMGMWYNLGINPYDAKGKLKDPEQLALETAVNIEGRTKDPRERAGLLRKSGFGPEMVQFLMMGSENIKKIIEEHRKLLPNIDEDIEKLNRYQQAVAKLDTAWQSLGMAITSLLAGPVTDFLNIVTGALNMVGTGPPKNPTRDEKNLAGDKPKTYGEAKFNKLMNGIFPDAKHGPLGDDSIETGSKKSKRKMAEEIIGQHPEIAYYLLQSGGFGGYVAKTEFDYDGKFSAPPRASFRDRFGAGKPFDYKYNDYGLAGSKPGGTTITNHNNVTVNDKSGDPGKQAGLALEHINRANRAYGVGTVAVG